MEKKDVMIKVDNVSMRFNLGIEKGFSLKQGFVDLFNKEKRKAKKNKSNEFWALKMLILKYIVVRLWALLVLMVLENQRF